MAKVIQVLQAMDKQDRDNYQLGFNADVNTKNPYDCAVHIRMAQAWSAGHFDKWGRV